MAPSELQPPFNYADGGAVGWAGDTTVYNTQSQIGNMLATPGGFSGMSKQFTEPSPMAMAEGGLVNSLASRLAQEFSKRGLDLNKFMARRLAQQGQSGDTMLAHINPEEAQMLKDAGGSGKINPNTGLPSFGVDDGPERGSTGSASGASYGGGSSVGSGGGSNQSANAAMGRESPAQRDVSYGGGGGGESDRGDRGSSAPSPAAARAAEEASMAALKDVMATSPAALMPASLRDVYSQANYQSDLLNRQMAEQNAAEADYKTQRNLSLEGLKNLPDPLLSISPVVAARQAADKAAMTYRGVNPNEAFGEPFGEFETQPSPLDAYSQVVNVPRPIDPFYGQMENLNEKLARLKAEGEQIKQAQAARPVSPNEAYGGTPQEFEGQPSPLEAYSRVKTVPTSPFESVVKSMTDIASMSDAAKGSLIDAARQKPQPAVFTQPSPTEDIYTYTPPATAKPVAQAVVKQPVVTTETTTSAKPAPVNEEVAVPVKAAPVFTAAAAKKTVAAPVATTQAAKPADQGILSKIMADINNANAKRIAELEKAGEFAGGSKADVAAALKVDPSQLQSRIVNYDGRQKVDYFTKGLDQVLGDIVSGPFKALGNLFGGGNYDLKNGYSITPSGDVVPTPVYTPPTGGGGGGGGMAQAPAPVQAAVVTPAVTTPVSPALPQALASFKRKYVPLTNYAQYGYGPESALYEYTAAEGGPVGPLSQKRK